MRWYLLLGIASVLVLLVGCGRMSTVTTNLPAPLRQAEQYLSRGDLAAARQTVDTYLQQSPTFRSYLLVLALWSDHEQYALSAEYAQRALNDSRLRLNSLEEAQLWQIRADSLGYLRRYEEAARCYEEVLQRTPANPVALNNYAYLLAEANTRLDEAEAMANRALAAEPKNPIYLDTLGWIYFRQGRYQQAVQLLEQAVQDAPQEPELRYHLGMAYWMRGRLPEARIELRKAANLWRIQKGKPYEEALKALEQIEKGIPPQRQRERIEL
ncbi:MAG: tetratricopeptide repeat protein [Armatimonadota bacterium]|nr:tetratricopeptide repeat protein [bacterium]MCS7309702.1 tetratricopeptide repeat protein [Armatimonadota bacterium]MDW8104594.1 tetratricopeptide repeat protein [Armatimonadota bacterium]MDW8290074.1 tetratricopeptide repeat protein [Armatimonadota bacterium]